MAKINRIEPKVPALKKRQRVAAYARVSMETDRLAHSLSAQVSYYNGLIQGNPEWEYAGVYADFGISGTGTAARSEFLRLIADCEAGKVDIVLTKSISRFARNTVDLLSTVRHLKGIGVEVRFEKERIHSFSGDGELMLSILASFAQEESRSISENSKWGIRKRYQSGEIGVKNKRVFGYSYDGENYEVVPEEAEAVRLIFDRFTSGVPLGKIKSELEVMGIKSWKGYSLSYSHLNYILRNEIYIGDRRYQKCFIEDPIRKNKVKNQGQLPQYYVENDHTAIISREVFGKAQNEIIRRAALYRPSRREPCVPFLRRRGENMAKNVTTIPATRGRFTADPISSRKKRRVAGYARVSTDMEDQQTSYNAQCDYYTNYIQSREDWEFVKLYSDEGISATSTRHRDGFNQMVEDALAGRIDLIITKSVSRFARNTVDSLSTIRKLKENGCECYFEKENIWTFDSRGELLITIMSSLAQEESRSISENCTWGMRKRFADGKVSVPFGRFLGYDRGEDGNLVINEGQAKTVRKIYGLFLQGHSPYKIAKMLTEEGIPTPGGKKVWGKAVVESILTNEKYKGDALLQKVYTVDFLSKKKKVNEGEVPQYYVEGNHPAIIEPDLFDNVQALMKARRSGKNRNSCVGVFSGKIKCGDCGSWYGSKVWHSNDKYRKVIWQCNHKFDGGEKCTTPHLDEKAIRTLFVRALNSFCREREEITAAFEEMEETAFGTDELDRAEERLGEVEEEITAKQAQREMMQNFMDTLKGMRSIVDCFDEEAWYALVDYVTVYSKDDVRFTFKNGVEVKA